MPTRTDSSSTSVPGRAGRRRFGHVEFVALMAFTLSLLAVGIDMMLPAFPAIRAEFGMPPDANRVAGIVSAYFFGMAVAQLWYGPLADRFGRKPVLWTGLGIFAVGALIGAAAQSFATLLAARFLWGVGAAAPRTVTLAMVRDRYQGVEMARTMSFVLAVFLIVPIFAPAAGAAVLTVGTWRTLFGILAAGAGLIALWLLRCPETLAPEDRRTLRIADVGAAFVTVIRSRPTVGYTLAITFLYGMLFSYLGSSEVIIADVYGLADRFPIIFGAVAAVMASAVIVNGRAVRRIGMHRAAKWAFGSYALVAAGLGAAGLANGGRPPFWLFVALVAAALGLHSIAVPNANAIAMEPVGGVAGTASAFIGAFTTAGGAALGALVDQAFDGTVTPFAAGAAVFGGLALAADFLTRRHSVSTGALGAAR